MIYLSNGRVAWAIGDPRLADWYHRKIYIPTEGWAVDAHLRSQDWQQELFGNLRIKEVKDNGHKGTFQPSKG